MTTASRNPAPHRRVSFGWASRPRSLPVLQAPSPSTSRQPPFTSQETSAASASATFPAALHSPRQMPYPPIHSAPSQTTLASTV